MLQIVQYQKTGKLTVENVPKPLLRGAGVLVENQFSLISVGTEKTSVKTAQASLAGKARLRPDLVQQVLNSVKREGFVATYNKVRSRLDAYKDLGYSSAGIVIESSVDRFKVGDRVACGGGGYASHAEVVFVPVNLVSKIPGNVTFEEAAFTTLASIAMQGVRQANTHIGENVAVIGLGLIGLIAIQILKANGCRVIGVDVRSETFELARRLGCDDCIRSDHDALRKIEVFTHGYGTDAVLITAATSSNDPLELAIQCARKKSAVVVVGAVGMNVPRSPFYEKELDLKISCSYGPGRYDGDYEENGIDYPIGYVRWTENRNMEAVLDLMAQRKLDVQSLVTHTFPIQDALRAYDLILETKKKEKYLGILISYPKRKDQDISVIETTAGRVIASSRLDICAGLIGAGNFAQSNLIPHLSRAGVRLKSVADATPSNALSVGKKFKFSLCTSNPEDVLEDPDINAVFIATRHDSHARFTIAAIQKGKHVFVEKPIAIGPNELEDLKKAYNKSRVDGGTHVSVGFNRRFSLPLIDIRAFISESNEPLVINYRVHAGFVPKTHWIHEASQGGRIIGEGCHFVDCMTFLTGSRPKTVFARALESRNVQAGIFDNVDAVITFDDGSVGNLLYLANGDSSVPKEYCEVYSGGRTAILENFDKVTYFANSRKRTRSYNGGKGHLEEMKDFVEVVRGQKEPSLTFESIYWTTRTTFDILKSLKDESVVRIR